MKKKQKPVRIRCFAGIKFPLYQELTPLLDELHPLGLSEPLKLRVSPPENLHITLKFLGSVEQENLKFIQATLAEIGNKHRHFELSSTGLGFFKGSLWIGIDKSDYLEQIVTDMSHAFAVQPSVEDSRPFVPHVTLAKFNNKAKSELTNLYETYADHKWGSFTVGQLQLYKSETLDMGAQYTLLNSYDCLAET
ncbi:MAG: RNA 2',3'-cyclic phosphodiesterase [Gammaproteobacteria bacterium]|jgi:2'-5' RNA ligase|nr:RNA 2',3'-cyclic phosphodiesterase [Gammaproteobacteria bacterium]MBT3858570.1 RNA 2',3'-cyclic phosphodiesterase [Gammaproteobacteria bacterium]MBT3986692.1 RNA 2',3'-cyclic phosphodiesterase [Gammaproteobacteria bacterium]MBT4257020.1 RNA 2',3'-cyclic phosphodiesterase [Gammaproteobacteria bacterium]MBT4582788.1 RNA 2',3'-cyclic phosphodiesterase [Gammaproteobacteria bacterium]